MVNDKEGFKSPRLLVLNKQAKRPCSLAWFAGFTVLWALLYLPNLRISPPWYGDETYVVGNSLQVFHGEWVNYALNNTFLHVSYPYQFPYTWISGFFRWAFLGDIFGPRLFNTLVCLFAVYFMLWEGAKVFGEGVAILQALIFIGYDQSVVHYRYVFAHNLAGIGLLITTIYLLHSSSPKNDFKVGIGILLSACAHPLATHVGISAFLCRLRKPSTWIFLTLPSIIYLALFLPAVYKMFGNTFLDDIQSHLFLYTKTSSETSAGILSNIYLFYSMDFFHVCCLVSFFFLFRKELYPLAMCTLIPSLLLLQNRANLPVFYYQAMLILPNLCCCLAVGIKGLYDFLWTRIKQPALKNLCGWTVLLIPLWWLVPNILRSFTGTVTPKNIYWATQNHNDVEAAAKWINANTKQTDLVIANMMISWLLNCRSTHLLQVAAWEGFKTHGFEKGMPKERFRYPANYKMAKFFVLGDIDFRWTLGELGVREIISRLETEGWPCVWKSETYLVFKNPNYKENKFQ